MPPGARALQAQRETIAFEQHRRLNELAHQKMSLEIRALETQIKLMEADLRRRDDAGEHASAALEKTRLEVESLRLHIREQRKRLDDYGQFE
jgi:septal ring factor EnvC (AmiA/AmiB activator)